jgi:hypothetical protein
MIRGGVVIFIFGAAVVSPNVLFILLHRVPRVSAGARHVHSGQEQFLLPIGTVSRHFRSEKATNAGLGKEHGNKPWQTSSRSTFLGLSNPTR